MAPAYGAQGKSGSGPVEFLGREHELVFGFNGFYRDYFASGYTETIDAVEYIDVRDHDPTAVPGPDSLPWVIYGDDSDTETLQYGVFAAGRFNPTDSFHVILGGRLSWYELTTEGVELLKEEGEFTPYAGVVYDITDDVSLYASYASIFNPNSPDTKDITGDVLPPQVGDQYEIGAKAELFDGLNASLALFRIEQNNLAEIDPAGTPGLCNGGDCYTPLGSWLARASRSARQARYCQDGTFLAVTPIWISATPPASAMASGFARKRQAIFLSF